MYVCCGDIAWGRNEQIAGGYEGDMPYDYIQKVEDNKKSLGELIAHRLKILTELQSLLSSWESRSKDWSSESVNRLGYAQAILPIVREHYESYKSKLVDNCKAADITDLRVELLALKYRTIKHRLYTLKFCDSSTETDRRAFLLEVDYVFSKLRRDMTKQEEHAVLLSRADQREPALNSCFEKMYDELTAINRTIFRGIIAEGENWNDAPGHCQEQSTADVQLLDPRCAAVLAVAIVLGYNGDCSCLRCTLSRMMQAHQPKVRQRCSVVTAAPFTGKPPTHQQGCNDQVIKVVRKAGIVIDPDMDSIQPPTSSNTQSVRTSKSATHMARDQRPSAKDAKRVSCLGCKPTFLSDRAQDNLANSL